ncbi:Radical SAM superfamily protein [Rosistilla oblonga]|uniref:radical SAM protein n=1 Tax=Rosistilla oblonga TaxID=2527990 RepID=UPI00118ACF49|nr:radical SAM protein [Rosistilla oblonga]QDV14202.1 Radical SAM superfamily protein [Rosistilla oblonga]
MIDRDRPIEDPAPRELAEAINDRQILAARGPKNRVDPRRAYQAFVEPEFSVDRIVEDVATIFLTNRECPFRCLMCDLWKNTTDDRVPPGAIVQQIEHALASLPAAPRIKLYNSGNFFDAAAVPREDLPRIAKIVGGHRSVIIENHPKLCDDRALRFRDQCGTDLEVAIGLETSHPPTLQRLNKQITRDDFARAAEFLTSNGIRVRAFILLRPPWTTEGEGIERAIESVRFAFNSGVDCCAVIPTRSGNGIMERLQREGLFTPPRLTSLETVLDETLRWQSGIVLADLWDAEQFASCPVCARQRIDRLQRMNMTQTVPPPVTCPACDSDGGGRFE